MEPSNYGKEILRKNRIFKFKNANFSNTCIILWLKFSATLHLGGGWGGRCYPHLSSPRAGPKGLRAESVRAFTGRRNSHSGRGEDFLSRQPIFFYGNSCNSRMESRKNVAKVGN